MTRTYFDLQTTINDDFLNRDMGDVTRRAIKRAISTYESKRHFFNETMTTVACVSGDRFLSLPDDYFHLDRLEITCNAVQSELYERDFSTVRLMNLAPGTDGQPVIYAIRGNRIELAPAPDSAYSIDVYYLHTQPDLSADTDSNAWTNECFNLIAHHAALDIMANVLQVADQAKIANQTAFLKVAQSELAMRDEAHLITRLSNSEES
jgi:hypothetical protein